MHFITAAAAAADADANALATGHSVTWLVNNGPSNWSKGTGPWPTKGDNNDSQVLMLPLRDLQHPHLGLDWSGVE